ncbi:MAG: LptA/OstA family protein [Verrucomicrobiota bacterium]|jgi:lipopolysaccharide export system protein LptA
MKDRLARNFCLIGLLALASGRTLLAQTDTNAVVEKATNAAAVVFLPAATNANVVLPPKPRPPTQIKADRGDFDWELRQATYHGRVQVDDPEMKLASEWLMADVPQAGERVNHIVAETNVVIDFVDGKGQTNHATGAKAVYVYEVKGGTTNETITLSGNPQIDNPDGTLTGDVIVWDRVNNHLSATNPRMVFRQKLNGPTAGTNMPPATNPPAADTTFPPGKLDLIPEPHAAPRNF